MKAEMPINEIVGSCVAKKCMYCSADKSELRFLGYAKGSNKWVSFYECKHCNRKYSFMPNDMGQTADVLAHIKDVGDIG